MGGFHFGDLWGFGFKFLGIRAFGAPSRTCQSRSVGLRGASHELHLRRKSGGAFL